MRYWKPREIVGKPLVGIAIASYLNNDWDRRHAALCCLLYSLLAQTYQNWTALVVHDGPVVKPPNLPNDPRIVFETTPLRAQQFGHPHREAALAKLRSDGAEWLGLSNDDNYYVPVYLEWMLSEAQRSKAEFVYCDAVHSHKQWSVLAAELRRGKIDLGHFLANKRLTQSIAFDKYTFAGDWDYISRLQAVARRKVKVTGTLFVHN